jgi:hypothetical protein
MSWGDKVGMINEYFYRSYPPGVLTNRLNSKIGFLATQLRETDVSLSDARERQVQARKILAAGAASPMRNKICRPRRIQA